MWCDSMDWESEIYEEKLVERCHVYKQAYYIKNMASATKSKKRKMNME